MSSILAVIVGGMHCFIMAEVGLAQAVEAFVEKPLFSIVTVVLLATPLCLIRRKPGWIGYLLGSFSGLTLTAYFVYRAVFQFATWHPGLPLGYPLLGAAFALPFVWLLVAFVFSRANREFHGVTFRHLRDTLAAPRDGE